MEAVSVSELDEISICFTGHSMMFTRCPMYCPKTCTVQHHPLLLAVINCVDTPEIELMEKKLLMLSNMINKYAQSGQWSGNDPIPDVVERYRAPMLHWVATFGRVGAAIWLIGHNISDPTTRSAVYNGETALHRALLCLQETCPVEPGHKFVQLLSVLEPALSVADDSGNTPLHVCCNRVVAGGDKAEYYRKCLHYMLNELSNEKKVAKHNAAVVLNMKNNNGDTGLHFLAKHKRFLPEIKSLVQLGADYTIENNIYLSPYDVAKKYQCHVICDFFESILDGEQQEISHINLKINKSKYLDEDNKTGLRVDDHVPPSASSPLGNSSSSQPESISENEPSPLVISTLATHNDRDIKDIGDTDSDDPSTKRIKTEDSSLDNNCHTQLQSDDHIAEGSETLDNKQATEGLSVPKLFSNPEDSDAQEYFEQTVAKHISIVKSKKQVKKSNVALYEPPSLRSCLDLIQQGDSELLKKTLMEVDPAVVTEHLINTEDVETCEPVIQFMLNTRNDALNNLKLANKCEDGIQQLLKDNQKTQESLVSDIMMKYDILAKLNKEENLLNSEITKIRESAATVRTTNSSLRERLSNCEAAIGLLKRLYAEAKGTTSKN